MPGHGFSPTRSESWNRKKARADYPHRSAAAFRLRCAGSRRTRQGTWQINSSLGDAPTDAEVESCIEKLRVNDQPEEWCRAEADAAVNEAPTTCIVLEPRRATWTPNADWEAYSQLRARCGFALNLQQLIDGLWTPEGCSLKDVLRAFLDQSAGRLRALALPVEEDTNHRLEVVDGLITASP